MSMPEHMQIEDLEWHLVVIVIVVLGIVSCALGVYGEPWVIIFALAYATVAHEMPLTRGGHLTASFIVGACFALGLLWSKPLGTAVLEGALWALCMLVGAAWETIASFLKKPRKDLRRAYETPSVNRAVRVLPLSLLHVREKRSTLPRHSNREPDKCRDGPHRSCRYTRICLTDQGQWVTKRRPR